MSLVERGLPASITLASLLSGAQRPVAGSTDIDLPAYVEEILTGGFPGLRSLRGRAHRAQLDGYLDRGDRDDGTFALIGAIAKSTL